ncbi:lipocalin family protein [Aquimarina sp. 2201CG14-23]|uniref:lipocalin family protein n=1 Tax=Aquimarina mycalae TaxID=3040073 RepID=UPI0024780C08|nr:lipocalin family protein [Aquimarina sp. 2201CG14-23]MDH7445405.1 lipocalin family protein [Aquimarina sp. 2201CG14-23]
MKTNFFLFAISIALFFTSCSSDDDNGGDPTTISIVGTWQLTSASGVLPVDLNMDGMASTNLLEELPCFEDTITVSDDNTYSQDVTEITVNVDTSGPLPVVTAECTGNTLTETGTWSLDGDELTFTPTGMNVNTVTIVLTETTLSFTDTVADLGQVALVFTRQ